LINCPELGQQFPAPLPVNFLNPAEKAVNRFAYLWLGRNPDNFLLIPCVCAKIASFGHNFVIFASDLKNAL